MLHSILKEKVSLRHGRCSIFSPFAGQESDVNTSLMEKPKGEKFFWLLCCHKSAFSLILFNPTIFRKKKNIKPQNPIGHPSKPRRPSPNYFKYLCSIFKAYCKAYLGQSLWNGHNLKLGFLYPWEGQKRQRMIILLLQKQVGWEWLYLILEVFCGALAFGKTEQKSNW